MQFFCSQIAVTTTSTTSSQTPRASPILGVTALAARLRQSIFFRQFQRLAEIWAAADGTCVTARNSNTFPDNRCSNVHAVVSIASVDNLANMPGTYGLPTNQPILGPTIGPSGMIAQNWNSFINGALNNSLTAAGALPSSTSWWSFSAATGGTQTANNCSNGMSTTGNADVGSSTSTSTTAINSGTTTSCLSPQQQLLCVCF